MIILIGILGNHGNRGPTVCIQNCGIGGTVVSRYLDITEIGVVRFLVPQKVCYLTCGLVTSHLWKIVDMSNQVKTL